MGQGKHRHDGLMAQLGHRSEFRRAGEGDSERVIRSLVRLAGFEPAAYGLEVRCSIQLSYRRVRKYYHSIEIDLFQRSKLIQLGIIYYIACPLKIDSSVKSRIHHVLVPKL